MTLGLFVILSQCLIGGFRTEYIYPATTIIGLLITVLGLDLRGKAIGALGETWSARVTRPVFIVTKGPYRVIRHPQYAGEMLTMLGLSILFLDWILILVGILFSVTVYKNRMYMEELLIMRESSMPLRAKWANHFDQKNRLIPGVY